MHLEGDVEGSGDLLVLGQVTGTLRVDGEVVIELGALVRGEVRGARVTIRGTLAGDAHASEAIWVERDARVVGDLVGPRVKVVEGASFRGRLRIERPVPAAPPVGEAPHVAADRPAAREPAGRGGAPLPRMPRPTRASGTRRAAL